jgi:CRISPR/Cas system-associated exonuclease Cas4 (RecB family)
MKRKIAPGLSFKPKMNFDADQFNKIIESGYLASKRHDEFKQKSSFSPSTIGGYHGTCPRYWFTAFNGAEFIDTFDALGVASMNTGIDAHTRIQKILKDADLDVKVEVEVLYEDPPIRGFADLLIDWNGTAVVGEIKTTKQELFNHRVGTNKPYASHYLQILLYMYILQAPEGFLLYENKNTGEYITIPVAMTPAKIEIVERVLAWMRGVYAAYQDNVAPVRPFTKKSPICKKCPVAKTCWNTEYTDHIDIAVLEVPNP